MNREESTASMASGADRNPIRPAQEAARGDAPPKTLLFFPAMDFEYHRITTGQTNIRRPPLGFQYLMAVLRAAGYPFIYRDQVVQNVTLDALVADLNAGGYDILGIQSNLMTEAAVCRIVRAVKEGSRAKVLVGGPGAIQGRPYLDAGADAVLVGEAERRLVPVLDALAGGGDVAGVPGMLYRGARGEIAQTAPPPFLDDLDALPFPYRDPALVPKWGEPVNPAQTGTYIGLISSRGCPYHCTFCVAHDLWDNTIRYRSVDNVLAEMDEVLREWPRAYCSFLDDCFGVHGAWVEEFCAKKIERRDRSSWMCIMHPMAFPKNQATVLARMAAAGCNCISYGLPSSVPEVLRLAKRFPEEPARLAEAIALCKHHDILAVVTFIYGLPGETRETLAANVRWLLRHRPQLADIHPLYVFPRTEVQEMFRDGRFVPMADEEIERACARSFRAFYSRPGVLWTIASFILRRNPRFLYRMLFPLKRLAMSTLRTGRARLTNPRLASLR